MAAILLRVATSVASAERHDRVDGIGYIRRRCRATAETRRKDRIFEHLRDEPVPRLVAIMRCLRVSARFEGGTLSLT